MMCSLSAYYIGIVQAIACVNESQESNSEGIKTCVTVSSFSLFTWIKKDLNNLTAGWVEASAWACWLVWVMHQKVRHPSIIRFSAICATVALLWDWMTWASFCSRFTSVRLWHLLPCLWLHRNLPVDITLQGSLFSRRTPVHSSTKLKMSCVKLIQIFAHALFLLVTHQLHELTFY